MSDYICEKCGNECELEDALLYSDETDEYAKFFFTSCCGVDYYEKEDELWVH